MPQAAAPASARNRGARLRGVALTLGTALWIALPLGGFWALSTGSAEAPIARPAEAWVSPEPAGEHIEAAVAVMVDRAPAAAMRAPAWSGLVQRVLVSPGDAVDSGTPIAMIDGITRVAMIAEAPLYRPLTVGDRGPDVADYHAFLARIGVSSPAGTLFTARSARATGELARRLGAPAPPEGVDADPAWLVFAPAPFSIATVELEAASPAPPAGEEIARGARRLGAAGVTDASVLSSLPSPERYRWDLDAEPRLRTSPHGGEALLLGDAVVAFDPHTGRVDASALPALAAIMGEDLPGVPARVRTPLPAGVWSLPAAALRPSAAAGGGECVRIARPPAGNPGDPSTGLESTPGRAPGGSGPAAGARPSGELIDVSVTAVTRSGASALVLGDLRPGDRVAVAIDLRGLTCGSD